MSQYIKINSDNSVQFLGNQLFNSIQEDQVFYTGYVPNGDFLIWDETSNSVLEDFETRRQKELGNIRDARDQLLKDTDWVIIKSLEGGDIDPEWIEYRQELRDLPSQYSLTGLINLPAPPMSGLHNHVEIEKLQPYTLRLINQEAEQEAQQQVNEDWGDWWRENNEEIESGSGIDPTTMIPSGITGEMIEQFINLAIWDSKRNIWCNERDVIDALFPWTGDPLNAE